LRKTCCSIESEKVIDHQHDSFIEGAKPLETSDERSRTGCVFKPRPYRVPIELPRCTNKRQTRATPCFKLPKDL
jgi:hypothetical protein